MLYRKGGLQGMGRIEEIRLGGGRVLAWNTGVGRRGSY